MCIVRILCGVTFFAPFLGLGNILAHWVAESKSLSPKIMSNLNSTNAYWNASTVSAIYRSDSDRNVNCKIYADTLDTKKNFCHRSDYTDPELPISVPYTAYTNVRLRYGFIIFVGLFLIHGFFITLIKRTLSPQFKAANWNNKLQHILIANLFPDCFKDWETEYGNLKKMNVCDYRNSRCAVTKEILTMILLQFMSNLALLTPLFITGELYMLASS